MVAVRVLCLLTVDSHVYRETNDIALWHYVGDNRFLAFVPFYSTYDVIFSSRSSLLLSLYYCVAVIEVYVAVRSFPFPLRSSLSPSSSQIS